MLKRENRLKTRYEFSKTRRHGEQLSTDYFHLYYLPYFVEKDQQDRGAERNPTRIGIVISGKFSKSAVERNRVKRIFREVVRQNFGRIRPGYWVVIHPRIKSKKASYEEINTEFIKILQKVPFSREL